MINKVIITGRLTSKAEIRVNTDYDYAVAKISIAVNKNYKKNQEWETETYFFDIEIIESLGKVDKISKLEKLEKGDLVLVEGELRQERWKDKEGKSKSRVKIYASNITLLSKPANKPMIEEENLEELEIPPVGVEEDDDVPF